VLDTTGLGDDASVTRELLENRAPVVNLSLGGYTEDDRAPTAIGAVVRALTRSVVVVAAAGNNSSHRPFWPAAFKGVLAVAAYQSSRVPIPAKFSNHGAWVDVCAPGTDIVSTFATFPTAKGKAHLFDGWAMWDGTSFAAPQVAAAAALVLAVRPDLRGDQVVALLERTADDANAATGCAQCPLLRDQYSGWGTLNVQKALQVATAGGEIPPADAYETNDDAGPWAWKLFGQRGRTLRATLDYWDDQVDVYAIYLRRGQRLYVHVQGPQHTELSSSLWRPGTKTIAGLHADVARRLATARHVRNQERLALVARETGTYYVAVKLQTQAAAQYLLAYAKR